MIVSDGLMVRQGAEESGRAHTLATPLYHGPQWFETAAAARHLQLI